ncbi:hypothetical protein BOX15_Mlig017122g1, partial [Macrostomum lignano]
AGQQNPVEVNNFDNNNLANNNDGNAEVPQPEVGQQQLGELIHVLRCPACTFMTLVPDTLRLHLSTGHAELGHKLRCVLYRCPVCARCLTTELCILLEHIEFFHPDRLLSLTRCKA